MDNNQNNNPPQGPQFINPQPGGVAAPPPVTPPQGPLQQPQVPPSSTPGNPKGGFLTGKMKFAVIGIVILILLLVIFGVFIMTRSSTKTQPTQTTTSQTNIELEKLTKLEQELNSELDAIDLGVVDQDFSDVDQELSSL